MQMKAALLLMTFAPPAWAECGGYDSTFLFCQIENSPKTLSVCYDEVTANYRFGLEFETPELEITAPIATLDYTPWPGVGSTIWEDVVFSNAGYTYTVSIGFSRIFPEDNDAEIETQVSGGVTVGRGNAVIAQVSCDAGTIMSDGDGRLEQAKNQLGYIWDKSAGAWVALPD